MPISSRSTLETLAGQKEEAKQAIDRILTQLGHRRTSRGDGDKQNCLRIVFSHALLTCWHQALDLRQEVPTENANAILVS